MKIKNKLKILICILAILIMQVNYVMAANNTVNLYHKKDCENFLKYNGIRIRTGYIEYIQNNISYPAYCLNLELPGVGEVGAYDVKLTNKIDDINLWRVLINGYPYKTFEELGVADEEEAFTATKQAIYITLYNRNVEDYSAIETEAGKRTYEALKLILNNAQKSTEKPVNGVKINVNSVKEEWEADGEFLTKTYTVSSNVNSGSFKIANVTSKFKNIKICDENNNEKNTFNLNEKVKVLIPIQDLTENKSIKLRILATLNSFPIFVGEPNSSEHQAYAITGIETEELNSYINETINKNITSLKIVKKEYGTENLLKGVTFDILNENSEVIYKDLETDENGEIIIKNLLPGKYFVHEKNTLDGYIKYNEKIEVEIPYNCEYVLNVENKKEEEKKHVIDEFIEKDVTIEKELEIKKLPVTGM